MLYRIAVIAALCFIPKSTMAGQPTCPADTGGFTQQANVSVKTTDSSCTVDDRRYIKASGIYKLHVGVQVGGWCQTYISIDGNCSTPGTYFNRTASQTNQGLITPSLGT
jgi:hypothetical protein